MSATLFSVLAGLDPFDAASLSTLRSLLAGVDPEGPPRILSLQPVKRAKALCLIPGSFNPPTVAHVALADRALSDGFDSVHFTYSVRTIGKRPTALAAEDRLLLARAAAPKGAGVCVASVGLLADLAEAASATFDPVDLSFMIGGDKLEQLFEHRWYSDRDEALDRLFALARVMVAPRRDDGERIARLIREHPRWAPRIDVCHLHPSIAEISSTRVRQVLRQGGDPSGLVPEEVARYLRDVAAFAKPVDLDGQATDLYMLREQLFDLVLDGHAMSRETPDLHVLWRLAHDPGTQGRQLRTMLSNGSLDRSGSLRT